MLDTIRKLFSAWIFRNKDERYHPQEEERLHRERIAEQAREKERSRVHSVTEKQKAKHRQNHPPLYEKRRTPSYSSLEITYPSSFHRSAPVCRKLRVNSKSVM